MQRTRFSIAVAVLVACALVPSQAMAQCSVTFTATGSYTMGGMDVNYVIKYLSTTYTCTVSMSTNVIACNGGVNTTAVSGTAYPSIPSAACGFNCDCGTVTIDGSDGLPVELLDFSVGGGR